MTVYSKPSTWCLMLHQLYWEEEVLTYCPKCDKTFHYPTDRNSPPVYK